MRHKVFSIFDTAAAAFLPPFVVPTVGVVVRQLRDLPETQPTHPFVRHAEQYTLFELGAFDDSTGRFEDLGQEAVWNLKVLFSQGELEVSNA